MRLLPLTKSQPKEMLPVGNRPVVQYVVEELALSGIHRILFITGPGKTSIENHFDIDSELIAFLRESGREELLAELGYERQRLEYFYTRQRRQLGLGHAVLCARSLVGNQPFVVALGDSIIGVHAQSNIVRRMTEEFERAKAEVVVAVEEVPADAVGQFGIVRPAGDGEVFPIADLVEKPNVREAPSNLAVAARYVCSPAVFFALERTDPDERGEIQLTDAIARLARTGARVVGMRLAATERRFDIGSFDSYFRTFLRFVLADERYGPGLRQYVRELLGADESGRAGSGQ
jgi:UTP--glucose-1-phosphate uridylyltransferase